MGTMTDRGATLPAATGHVKRINQTELGDIAAIKERVDATMDTHQQQVRLSYEMDHTPDGISVYVAYVDGAPAACAWVRFPEASAFASLWGGGTLPQWRGRGVFRSLVADRAGLAAARGFRYLQVDAMPASRPILTRLACVELATPPPHTHPAGAAGPPTPRRSRPPARDH